MKKFYELKVRNIIKETDDAVVVEFEVPEDLRDNFRFTHGQHLTLRKIINEKEVRRTYSICTTPSENCLQVAIKQIEDGKFSTFANHELQIGDYLQVMPAQGHFYTDLDPENKKNYVAFATGSGITPIMSIIKTVLLTEAHSTVTLFYGNRTRRTIIFKKRLEDLKNLFMSRLSIHHILSRENSDTELYHGRMDEEKIKKLLSVFAPPETIDEVFICGVHEMIFTVKAALKEMGIDPKHIHFELFTSPDGDLGSKQTEHSKKSIDIAADKSQVTVIIDGRGIVFPLSYQDQNILNAAIEQGADLPYACKSGVCSTCKAKLTKGKVDMDANYALEDEEVENGYILCCQSHPVTDEVVVDYDKV